MEKEQGVAKGEKERNTVDGSRAPERKFSGGNLSTIDLSNESFLFFFLFFKRACLSFTSSDLVILTMTLERIRVARARGALLFAKVTRQTDHLNTITRRSSSSRTC